MVADFMVSSLGGIRALLFTCALFSAATYIQEIGPSWSIICSIATGRPVRSGQIIGIASFGWFIGALSCMIFTSKRMVDTAFYGINPGALGGGHDAIWSVISFFGLAVGFYLPVFSMLWYREKLGFAICLGLAACFVGITFGFLTASLPVTHNR